MLAELAAANAAFSIIRKTLANTGDLAKAGKAISDFVIAKEELQRKGNKKRKPGVKTSDLEEFIALEKDSLARRAAQAVYDLRRPAGLWNDWQRSRQTRAKSAGCRKS